MVKICTYDDISVLLNEAERELKLKVPKGLHYWGYYENDKLVGFVTLQLYSNKAKLHSAFVIRSCRKKGIYKILDNAREEYIKKCGIHNIEANCTKDSIGMHIKKGATVIKKYKICTKITYTI